MIIFLFIMFYEQHVSSELHKDVPDALLLGSDNDISLMKPSAVKIPLRLEDLIAGEAWKEKPMPWNYSDPVVPVATVSI